MLNRTILVFSLVISVIAFAILFVEYRDSSDSYVQPRLNGTIQIIIVPYFPPTSNTWHTIYDAADKHPGTIRYVIINPCSGPCGPSLSQDWQDVISNLKGRGIKTLGYIFNTSENFSNIDYYMKAPSVRTDGIFFDNEGSIDNLKNFEVYADYVHRLGGLVYINPGYNYSYIRNYLSSGAADVANIHEIASTNSSQISPNKEFSPWQISVIVGNVTGSQEMASYISQIASKGIGTTYLYSDSYGNLPSFFADEIQEASVTKVRG